MTGAVIQPMFSWSQFIGTTLVIFAVAVAVATYLDRRDR